MTTKGTAVIVGVGPGLGRSLAFRFADSGLHVAMFARNAEYLSTLENEIKAGKGQASSFVCDVTQESSVESAFAEFNSKFKEAPLKLFIYNVASFKPTPFLNIKPSEMDIAWRSLCFGAFLTSQKVLPKLVDQGHGTMLFTGATASLKGSANFATLAVPKFGLRALTQTLAREFHPKGIHVAHVIVDGLIDTDNAKKFMGDAPEGHRLKPSALADVYYDLYKQDKSVWTHELDVRPFAEKF